jgi:ribonuclease Z
MRPAFHPRTINGPFGDPGLFIPFLFRSRALIFDLGETADLSNRELLKITHAFVTHTHMDHFAGFDRLLRLFLGREKTLFLYGPEGFLGNVEGKLAGYTWNLTANYENRFYIHAVEVQNKEMVQRTYPCREGFRATGPDQRRSFFGDLLVEPAFTVSAAILDHGIPCLGFALRERFHINILKDRVEGLGLAIGPWLNRFKEALYSGAAHETPLEAPLSAGGVRPFSLGDLAGKIAMITPGQKIAYVADAAGTPENAARITELARNADHLFIEAAFLHGDREAAREKRHLTARQAGEIAGAAGVKGMTVFHFSPRYSDHPHLLTEEAAAARKEAASAESP